MNRHIKLHAPLSALLIAILGGCTTLTPKSPEEAVRARAQERWVSMLSGKFDKAYELLSPSYRKVKDFESYRRGFGDSARWTRAEVALVNCPEPTKCNVNVEIGIQPMIPVGFKGTITTQVQESWVLEDGRWWLSPRS